MDKQLLVQNIKAYCKRKGVSPTAACRESGVGRSFIDNIERGRVPSVEKVQQLANYLGITTSELLGETQSKVSLDLINEVRGRTTPIEITISVSPETLAALLNILHDGTDAPHYRLVP